MNSFLGNLIDRHQEFSDHREMGYKVEPRPKAIFETEFVTATALDNDPSSDYRIAQRTKPDSETGSLLTQSHSAVVETLATDETSASRKQSPLETHKSPDNKSASPIDIHHFDDINERIKALSVKMVRKQFAQEEERIPLGDQNVQGAEALPDLNVRPEILSDNHFSLGGELNNRIQEILQHLQTQSTGAKLQAGNSHTDNHISQQPDLLQIPNQLADSSRKEIIEPAQFRIQPEIEPEKSNRSTKAKTQNGNGQSDNRVLQQPGLLQIPNWLTQMQADINTRGQEIYNKTETEPVVNVTIGRVEVLATQVQTPKKLKETAKPSGVMSLDEYLKQRERRSRM